MNSLKSVVFMTAIVVSITDRSALVWYLPQRHQRTHARAHGPEPLADRAHQSSPLESEPGSARERVCA
jgi:hypothetical protein